MVKVNELAKNAMEAMLDLAYSPVTTYRLYTSAMLPLVRYHEADGAKYFDANLTSEFSMQI